MNNNQISHTGENPFFASSSRLKAIKIVISFIALVFIARLAELQLIDKRKLLFPDIFCNKS
jgi:hypothetical protein